MMSIYEWRYRRQERSRQRMVSRIKFPERDRTKERLLTLETLREWGVIDEDEFRERRRALTDIGAPSGRAWELRAEVRAHDRRNRRRRP
jgi:hypothetical protein